MMERRGLRKSFRCRHIEASFSPPEDIFTVIYVSAVDDKKNEHIVSLGLEESPSEWQNKLSGFSKREIQMAWYLLSVMLEELRHRTPTALTGVHDSLMHKFRNASARLRINLEKQPYDFSGEFRREEKSMPAPSVSSP